MTIDSNDSNWIQVTPPGFAWEREALEYLQERLPQGETYGAWANFTFLTKTGRSYEVDALVMTPKGLFLVEIKSRPGRVGGDQGTWKWYQDGGRIVSGDNPLPLTAEKAKAFKGLLERTKVMQAASKRGKRFPWIEELAFMSHETNKLQLPAEFGTKVFARDRDDTPGIWHALSHIPAEEFQRKGRRIDRPTAELVRAAIDEVGIRHSMRSVTFGEYKLEKLVGSGPGYQDYLAKHESIDKRCRIRVYAPTNPVTAEEGKVIERAARREATILEGVHHPGIVPAFDFRQHERGPSVLYEWVPDAQRLDRYLDAHGSTLDLRARLALVRRIAEAVAYAHRRGIVHRTLNPQAVLIDGVERSDPQPRIIDWQVAFDADAKTSLTQGVTSHVGQLVDEPVQCYMAPEAVRADERIGPQVDVFGVGALAFLVLTGSAPASSALELADKIRQSGLDLAAHMDGVPERLRDAVMYATTGDLAVRWTGMDEFLSELAKAEEQLHVPDAGASVVDPAEAIPGDVITDELLVEERLGSGATAHALLVESDQDGRAVIKVSRGPEHDERIRREAETLHGLSHQGIVQLRRRLTVQGREAFLMTLAGRETLGKRLRDQGRLAADLLERWGTDLLQAVAYLEQVKAFHRDIKPDNIGVWEQPGSRELHLVLFDFSLAGTDATNIRAGTVPYLDPFLQDQSRKVWDQHAERFAAAMTLHEMATGQLPVWGSDGSDPYQIDDEVAIDSDLFDSSLASELTAFFRHALARNVADRFDTGEEMLLAWRRVFEVVAVAVTSDHADVATPEAIAESASRTDALAALGIAPRIVDLYARLGVDTVDDLLGIEIARINSLRGAGNKVRRDALRLYQALRAKFPTVETQLPDDDDSIVHSIDLLAQRVVPDSRKTEHEQTIAIRSLLGLHVGDVERGEYVRRRAWPSIEDAATLAGLPVEDVGERIDKSRRYWATRAAIRVLRDDIADVLASAGGVMSVDELASSVLAQRGSTQAEPQRSMDASAVTQAAVEAELSVKEPRWQLRRHADTPTVIALDTESIDALEVAAWAHSLGQRADELLEGDSDVVLRIDALDQLRLIEPPSDTQLLSDARLLALSAAASRTGALSSRAELYRVGLPAPRALELARGALLGARAQLSVGDVASRVRGRFPEAQPLPERPQLDHLLVDAGIDLKWNGEWNSYTSVSTDALTSISTSYTRYSTNVEGAFDPDDPEVIAAQTFEDRLSRSGTDGGFLCLKVRSDRYVEALDELRRFDATHLDVSARLNELMQQVAQDKGAQWSAILAADEAGPSGAHWSNLTSLAALAAQQLEQELVQASGLMVASSPGLLARYEQLTLIERLRDTAGTAGSSLHALWLVIPQDAPSQLPTIDGKAIPVIGKQHHADVPEPWIRNRHRARGNQGAPA